METLSQSLQKEDLEGEVWKSLPEFDNLYLVSNYGRVFSLKRSQNRLLKQTIDPKGYNGFAYCECDQYDYLPEKWCSWS